MHETKEGQGSDSREAITRTIDGSIYTELVVVETPWVRLQAAGPHAIPLITIGGMTAASYVGAPLWSVVAIGAAGLAFYWFALKRW